MSFQPSEQFPGGHFYSVIPSADNIAMMDILPFKDDLGVDIDMAGHEQILAIFKRLADTPPFYSSAKTKRFRIDNDNFSYDDAPVLHYMMRWLCPKRIIEIGSGFSSACMLDTNDNYMSQSVDFTFIDVDCSVLRMNLLPEDAANTQIIESPIQRVDKSIFSTLQPGDLLFVDSSHVMKAGSDLHTILFDVLPILAPGVWIHFHDIRYPFQYSKAMIYGGVFWNEAYVLRAFLMYNQVFKVKFWLNWFVNQVASNMDLISFLPLDAWARKFNNGVQDYSEAGGSIYLIKDGF